MKLLLITYTDYANIELNMSKTALALKNFLAAIYAIAITLIGAFMLFTVASMMTQMKAAIMPDPDVVDFLRGDW